MTVEVLLLALASTVRPSSFVAVFALVREPSPSRLMTAYVIAGLAFTCAVGVVVVWVCGGIGLNGGTHRTKSIAEMVAGALALGLAAAVVLGRLSIEGGIEAQRDGGRLTRMFEREITPRAAALAGPVTHIPGVLYIVALELIISQESDIAGEVLQVGIYNAVWFTLPILVLVICVVDPSAARTVVDRLEKWGAAHAAAVIAAIAFGTGCWLLIDGATSV
jgi:hypothetical protein